MVPKFIETLKITARPKGRKWVTEVHHRDRALFTSAAIESKAEAIAVATAAARLIDAAELKVVPDA